MNIELSEKQKIDYPILNAYKRIINFTSTRHGGISSGNYCSQNLSYLTGDLKKSVDENRKRFTKLLEIENNLIITPHQSHSSNVKKIDNDFLSKSTEEQQNYLQNIDALVTNKQNLCVAVATADCVPILLFDKKQDVVAAIHAGWRGTCSKIVCRTIDLMQNEFNTNPKEIIAAIGVSISANAYEVGEELIKYFVKENFQTELIFSRKNKKLFLNLSAANQQLMLTKGLLPENIEISNLCTFSNHTHFFSARRLGINSGRMLTGIMLKDK